MPFPFLTFIVLAPALLALSLLGNSRLVGGDGVRFLASAAATWTLGSACLAWLASGSPDVGSMNRAPWALVVYGLVALPSFTLMSVVNRPSGAPALVTQLTWALLAAAGTAVLSIPLLLISTCWVQDNCL